MEARAHIHVGGCLKSAALSTLLFEAFVSERPHVRRICIDASVIIHLSSYASTVMQAAATVAVVIPTTAAAL